LPDSASEHARLLARFGLGAEAETVYLTLVTRTDADCPALAELTGCPPTRVQAALTTLATAGLVHPDDDGGYRARAPEFAFRDLLTRRQRELDDDRAHVERLGEVFRRSAAARDASELVQVISGRAAVATAIRDLQERAQYEVRSLVKPPVIALPAQDNATVQTTRMAKGVCYRTVYEQGMFKDESELRLLELSLGAGELVRTTARLPVKMMLADSQQALIPLDRDSREPSAVLVRHSSLIDVLEALFEGVWTAATAVPSWKRAVDDASADSPGGTPDPDADVDAHTGQELPAEEMRLLALLVAGLTDQALSAHLGVSTRTVERRIRRLMDHAGAATRIQLVLQAARRGWI
jgi:DNA-binding NarL/FixJ family response regulator